MYSTKHLYKSRSQINNLSLYLKKLEKEQIKPKLNRRKEIIKIKVEINELENRKPTEKRTMKPKTDSLMTSIKSDKLLARSMREKRLEDTNYQCQVQERSYHPRKYYECFHTNKFIN